MNKVKQSELPDYYARLEAGFLLFNIDFETLAFRQQANHALQPIYYKNPTPVKYGFRAYLFGSPLQSDIKSWLNVEMDRTRDMILEILQSQADTAYAEFQYNLRPNLIQLLQFIANQIKQTQVELCAKKEVTS